MKNINIIIPYYASMTSVLKFFALYLISRWYGVSFAFPFLFLLLKTYQIFINKLYNFFPLTIVDYFHIIKSIYHKNYIKEIKLKSNYKKEEIIKLIKQFINNNNELRKVIVYKFCNYYWKKINDEEIFNKVFIIIKEDDNLDKKLSRKFELLKEPSYKIYFDENKQRVIVKYNDITFDNIFLLEKYIEESYDKKTIKNKKGNKFIKLIIEFVTFPIYLLLEIIVIITLSITY